MEIKDRVQEVLSETTLSIRYISNNIDVNESTIYRWRRGDTERFDADDLKKLARLLQINYNWLQFGKGNKENTTQIDSHVSEDQVRYRLTDVDNSTIEEPSLDDLPQLVRLRDKLDEKIRKLIDKKRS